MTLEQKQQTLNIALTGMQDFIKNANVSNDETGTQLILDSIVLREEDESYEYYQEKEDLVFDIINGVGFEDEDNISLDELGEIQQELENALEDLQEPSTLEGIRNKKIGELYKGVFEYQNPVQIVNVIGDNILVNLSGFGEEKIDFLAVRYDNIWYQVKLKVANSEFGAIANYMRLNKVAIVDVIDYDSIIEKPIVENIAIARVFLDSLENPDEDGWNRLKGVPNLDLSIAESLKK